jgi:HAD superfamily hydrolase (TIGR01490 family)
VRKGIAFFDFDGTITTKDTLLEFIKYSKGSLAFYLGFLINSPYLVAFKLKIISNQKAKEKVLKYFFRNTPLKTFDKLCEDFARDVIPKLIRPKAMEEIRRLKEEGITVVIVSASPENWVSIWAKEQSLPTIATLLDTDNDLITGTICGINCHGEEKVKRIMKQFKIEEYDDVYAYGDSSGDKQMLELATLKNFKPFRE